MMKFEIIVKEGDAFMKKKASLIKDLSEQYLKNAFKDTFYGEDVKEVEINIILIKTQPGYEKWFTPRPPRYYKHKVITFMGGEQLVLNKHYTIEIRFDNALYDEFLTADENETKKILARESMKALALLDNMPKRLKDFDKNRFRADVAALFKTLGWLP